MKRNFISLLALVIMAQVVLAVDPNTNLSTYYSSIDGKSNSASSDALRTQLCTVISTGYVSTGYSSLPNSIYAASTDPSDFYNGSSKTMEDIYSSYPYTSSQSGSSATTCGTGWNKEHTVPQSYFGEESPMKSDAHHVFPTDIKMNSVRSNYPYGENNASKDCSTYGYGHLGSSTFAGYSGTVFDPGEGGEHGSYKGDLARVYFYMVTRYRTTNFTSGSGNISFTYTNGIANLTDYMKNLMLKWHRQDPVSEKERIRNNAIYTHQKNRNPYVDYPCLVEYIWGEKVGESVELSALVSAYDASYTGNDCSGSGVDPLDPDYYAPVEGLSDSLLKSKLAEVTWSHYTKRYSYGSGKNNTWEAFWYTDRNEADNSVVDMYSNNKRYFNPSDMTASVTDCDIEHMFPNSWFGAKAGNAHAYCDLHHLVPSDYSANRSKSNRGPGVPTDTTFNNGVWVNGKDAGRDNLEVFCPPDEYKGDFARAFFYIAMAYGDTAVWQAEAVPNHMTNSDWHEFLPQTRDLLLEWHRNDPVSEKERVRMNTVYELQGNRNPFIDYPCLVEYIWGVRQGEAFNLDCSDTPVPPTKYTITWSVDGKKSTSEVTKGLRPSASSVTNCSESRVFVGWTTSSTVSEKPAELYTAATIPAATKATTYYAVYADKETEDGGGDFALYSGELTEGDYVIYYNGKAMKAAVASSRLGYVEVSVSADKIATKDASIIWHLSQTDGYWRIYNAGVNSYAAGTGAKNQAQLLEDGTDDKSQWTVSDTATYEFINKANAAKSVNANLRNNGTYGFACYATATGGALSLYKQSGKVTYTNYGLSCSTAKKVTITYHSNDGKDQMQVQETLQNTETELEANPYVRAHYSFEGWSLSAGGSKAYDDGGMIVPAGDVDLYAVWKEDPKYTLTFRNGDAVYMSLTDYAGEAIVGLTDPESCERYSFVGWSTNQYAAGNTETPEVSTPSVVPAANMYYYAVYSREVVVPGAPVYTKVTNTVNLENGKYLIVYEAGALAFDGSLGDLDVVSNSISVTINENTIAGSEAIDASTFTLTETSKSGVYTVQSASGYYIGQTSDANGMQKNKSLAYENTISFADGNANIVGSGGAYLRYNKTSGQTRFRYYKSTTYTSQQAIQLYKQTNAIGSSTTYYTTEPDCTPVVIPEYTLTFMSEGEKYDEVIGKEGEIWMVYDPESSCKEYTFSGWSEQTYATENTETPVLVNDFTIPAENKTYYAVYTKTKEAGSGLTNKYQKITSTSELTDANYLVVADTSKLLAMSTDWKNNYYLGSVEVTENDEVITTENSKIIWQIDENAGTITLNNSAAGYLYIEQSVKNEKTYYNIKLGDNTETNKFAYTVSEGVWVFSSTTCTDRQLEFYTKNAYWSCYTGQDAPIYLYKQQEGVIQKTYYSTTLDCSEGPSTALESEEVRVTARKMLINGQMYIVLGDRVYDITGQRVR